MSGGWSRYERRAASGQGCALLLFLLAMPVLMVGMGVVG